MGDRYGDFDDDDDDYALERVPITADSKRKRASAIIGDDGTYEEVLPVVSVERAIMENKQKHRAVVVRVTREGKGRNNPMARRLRYQLKYDIEDCPDDFVTDCDEFRFVDGIKDGHPIKLVHLPGRQVCKHIFSYISSV